ncbi:hypothetical protein LC085_07575 [Bacillus tianshenii]|uniref:hypothetical protein n=1 Tax=Sutcliffiella tianshenii TaxID=1463404 RepID=UPI001CD276C2|nr:hypothetical protein [Bacillus tianshenii]MCA1319771.1 hypothetical protein [Bacillus tianshenii]
MKKLLALLFAMTLLTACGNAATNELNEKDTDKAEAKTGDDATPASTEPKEAEEEEEPAEAESEDVWTYYNDATWSDDFNGLKFEIMKVVVTDKAPTIEDESAQESAVGVKFRFENTTEDKFTTYPDQAVLVTSTGEQIDMPDMWVSDSLGGEIDKGVIKEGNVIWYLERGEAEAIEWIKVSWDAHVGSEDEWDGERKEYEVELKLK